MLFITGLIAQMQVSRSSYKELQRESFADRTASRAEQSELMVFRLFTVCHTETFLRTFHRTRFLAMR